MNIKLRSLLTEKAIWKRSASPELYKSVFLTPNEMKVIKSTKPKPTDINKYQAQWDIEYDYYVTTYLSLSKKEYKKKEGWHIYITTATKINHETNDEYDDYDLSTYSQPFEGEENLKLLKQYIKEIMREI